MEEQKKFRLGIIGAGLFAEANHYPSLSLHFFDHVERAAICDLNIKRAERLADKYGWKRTYTDYNKMFESEQLDGVIVCVGAKFAPTVSIDVLEKGIPVYIEKPASIRYEDTERIAEVAKRKGLVVQVGHQKRHGIAYNRAMKIVADTENFGNIVHIESKMLGRMVFGTHYSCLLEWQCHNLDIVQAFCGKISEIEAKSYIQSHKLGGLTAMLRFESGALGALIWGTYGGDEQFSERIEIVSDKGKGVIVRNASEVIYYDGGDEGEVHWEHGWDPISKNQSHVFNGYVNEMLHFIDCVQNNKTPRPSIYDEAETMKNLYIIATKAGIPIEWEPAGSAL